METLVQGLLEEFAANYFMKLFYFCLRKTGDSYEAEELASDISLNIISAIQRGTIPTHFSAWVWQIARNRYSAWAERRARGCRSDSGADISELELADEGASVEEAWMRREELRLLRRELSFIASDYRCVLVPYYIEDRSVGEIARMHGFPEGTVKSKLFRGREMLKEGMNMAREFGSMSYRPENVGFSCDCSKFGVFGEPWSHLNRLLSKNILLAAYRTPSTGEELAIELGVALPYMEDELKWLTEATLLKQNGKKYETNFFILSARTQDRIYGSLRELAHELTDTVIEAVEYKVKCLEENGIRWQEGYKPTFMVSRRDSMGSLKEEQAAQLSRLRDRAREIALRQYALSRDVVMGEFPAFLKEDAYQAAFAVRHVFQLRGAVLEEALRKGYLTYDVGQERRMLGVYMEI